MRLALSLLFLLFNARFEARAGELYYTDFESMGTGDEALANREGWICTHSGYKLYGIDPESQHLTTGLGNAAILGGNELATIPTSVSRTVILRRDYNMDPVAANTEITSIRSLIGIGDSSLSNRRDNFEFAVYNNAGQLISSLQFDNSTLASADLTVRAATTSSTSLFGLPTLDGVVMQQGNRVLVKSQISAAQNGIYTVAQGQWVRAADFDTSQNNEVVSGKTVRVTEGNTNGNSSWILSTTGVIAVGTTPLTFLYASFAPLQNIYRTEFNAQSSSLTLVNTNTSFRHNYLYQLDIRINFRTNRWSVWLDELPIFSDEVFYSGPRERSLGKVAVQMIVKSAVSGGFQAGDNYLLFDSFLVRTDALPKMAVNSLTKSPGTAPVLSWDKEAGYSYRVEYADSLDGWLGTLSGATQTALLSGTMQFTDTSAADTARRFYRVVRISP